MSKSGRWQKQHFFDASNHDRRAVVLERGFCQDASMLGPGLGAVTTSRHKKQRVSPKSLVDDYSTWTPFHVSSKDKASDEVQLEEGAQEHVHDDDDNDNDSQPQESENVAADAHAADTGAKRKRYVSSDDPNAAWRLNAINILHELFRYDGLGDFLANPCCHACGASSTANESATRLFRCKDCHPLLQCLSCCLTTHQHMPLHRIEEYNGTYFLPRTLSGIGLVYQLGHGGLPCPFPDQLLRTMVVLDLNGIHSVSFHYCNCVVTHQPSHVQQVLRAGWYPATPTEPRTCATFQCMDSYRLLNVAANVNANDFIDVLERTSNAVNPSSVPDRYTSFGRMSRQWAFLHRCKRSGVGLHLKSMDSIAPGALSVRCWGCPWVGINLPSGWDTVDPKYSYLYMPILALDANFRLKNRLRLKERPDPSIAPGSAYFVATKPYKKFVAQYVSEKDVSTCIAFAALLLKDTKLTTGLRTSGVAGCACARHELVRPLGLGDLQKGERYVNMDYVFFSAIQNLGLPRIGVSYDIACQWQINLRERMARLPPHIKAPDNSVKFTFGLPRWHAVVHELKCRTNNSLSYQEGVGCTDGEGIERIWSLLNPASYSTKEMGEGNRHDHLDDRIDHHNFKKNLSHGLTLARRLKAALTERDKQIASFDSVDKGLLHSKRADWMKQIEVWKADKTQPNPYLLPDASFAPTEDNVREQLQAAADKEAQAGRTPVYGTSALACVAMGLKLEDIQASLIRESRVQHRTALQEATFRERRETFEEMLGRYRRLQETYMPGAIRAVQREELRRLPDAEPLPVEQTKLWLPSDIIPAERPTGCTANVISIEKQLRIARCTDALSSLRQHLHGKQYLIAFRNANVTGQKDSTKARSLIDNVGDRVDAEAEKYRRSQCALVSLCGSSIATSHPELRQSDVVLDDNLDPDLITVMKLGAIGSEAHRRPHVSAAKRTMSWIWTAGGGPEGGTQGHEFIRVEWSKALSRRDHWSEEVELLREEMKRVLRFLKWQSEWWTQNTPIINTDALHHPETAVVAGMRAYAAKQAAVYDGIAKDFRVIWRATK